MSRSESATVPALAGDGFTLVELLVVIAIIGIIAAIGVLGLRTQVAVWRLEEASQQVARTVDRARAISRSESRVTSVQFSAGTNSITLDGETVSLPSSVTVTTAPSESHVLFVPPFGAAFLSSDATFDTTDSQFQLEAVTLATSAYDNRSSTVRLVGVLGKPVIP